MDRPLGGITKYRCFAPLCNNTYYSNVRDPSYKNKHFFKFPSNDIICIEWFKFSERDINLKNRKSFLLCEDHFEAKCFKNELKARLNYFAIPTISKNINEPVSTIQVPANIVTPYLNLPHPEFLDMPSTSSAISAEPVGSIHDNATVSLITGMTGTADVIRKTPPQLPGILKSVGVRKVSELTPKKLKLYRHTRKLSSKVSVLKRQVLKCKTDLQSLSKLQKSKAFQTLENNLGPAGYRFILSQLKNSPRVPLARRWTIEDKVFALAIYKRGPRCYNFMKHFVKLPSKSTLTKLLNSIDFNTGINPGIFKELSNRVSKMKKLDRNCSLIFDEIAIAEAVHYNVKLDQAVGYEDLGSLGRTNRMANHALVFMVRGLRKRWKQPIAYYFIRDTVKTAHLKALILLIISELQKCGLTVLSTVCDQGPTNVGAVRQLSQGSSGPFFVVNEQRIVTIFDPPHLLKNTRNNFSKYNIVIGNKVAKWEHLVAVFKLDQQQRFKCMPKLRPEHFQLDRDRSMKMKVNVAARQMSHTVAATINCMSVHSADIPSEAIHTAEFISDMDKLFDSFNGLTYYGDFGKPLRKALSVTSDHIAFWNDMLKQIGEWKFVKPTDLSKVRNPRFVEGWVTSIKAVKELWDMCRKAGFKYLCLRCLNQDPLENLFCVIRQHGQGNTNPTSEQFSAALKSCVLNGLVSPTSKGANCEADNESLLCNLQELLTVPQGLPSVFDPSKLSLPKSNFPPCIDINIIDRQALEYVSGYIHKKIVLEDCDQCQPCLLSETVEPQHTFIYFKEYDTHKRLKYPTSDLTFFIAYVNDTTIALCDNNASLKHLRKSIVHYLESNVTIEWLKCEEHNEELKKKIIKWTVKLVVFHYFKNKNVTARDASSKKMKNLTHVTRCVIK